MRPTSFSLVLVLALSACGNDINLHTGDDPGQVTNTNTTTNPQTATAGSFTVDAGEDRVVSVGGLAELVATVAGEIEGADLSFTWTQLDGDGIAVLPAAAVVGLTAPDTVTTLLLEVVVVDGNDPSRTASDTVRLVVVRDASLAIFVEPDVGDDGADGSFGAPVQTFERGLELAGASGADLYLNNPDVASEFALGETIQLPDGVGLFGGFDTDWLRDARDNPTRLTVSQPVALEAAAHATDVFLSGLEIRAVAPVAGDIDSAGVVLMDVPNATLDRVVAIGSDLATDPTRSASGFRAGSSYGVRATGLVQLDIVESTLIGGRGATGPGGNPGGDGGDGADGGNASGITAGSGGSSGHNGASGGNGGAAVGGVVACAAGPDGTDGGGSSGGSGGDGASADLPPPWVICYTSYAGNGSSVWSTASTGSQGQPGEAHTYFEPDGGYWPYNGTGGSRGAGGSGGGGGGAGAGIDLDNGGGGGGGGEGGEGGAGGMGGAGAGGSFGLTVSDVVYTVMVESAVRTVGGGDGAPGGDGGWGGWGGDGGYGSDSGTRGGGDGGDGGTGGRGGAGGGGAGGPTAGIVALDGVLELDNVEISTGDAGSGQAPNAGDGGWNYGIVLDGANMLPSSVIYALGQPGDGGDVAEIR